MLLPDNNNNEEILFKKKISKKMDDWGRLVAEQSNARILFRDTQAKTA